MPRDLALDHVALAARPGIGWSLPPEDEQTIEILEPADLIDPYPPMSYGQLPVILALSLLGAVVLWFGWLLLARYLRARRPQQPKAPAAPASVDHRSEALLRVDEIQHAAEQGEISERSAHQQLSEVVREYVGAVSGIPTTRMTLYDLREARLEPVAAAVERTYPPAFGEDGYGDVASTAGVAREVIHQWS